MSWTGLVPEEFIEQAAALFAALNDAPHDPGTAPAVWDAQRVRERVNDLRPAYGCGPTRWRRDMTPPGNWPA